MGKLRDKMSNDLALRGLSEKTVKSYLGACRQFAKFFMRPPEELGAAEVKQYLLHLLQERKLARSTIKIAYSALKFLYEITLERTFYREKIPVMKTAKRLPTVLPREKIIEILTGIKNLKHRNIFQLMYSAGLRISEVTNLQVKDIDSKRMMIHIRSDKGNKDRYVPLSHNALADLRNYWLSYRPKLWLFSGRKPDEPMSCRLIQHKMADLRKKHGLEYFTSHHFRHCFAVHSLEAGCDILEVKQLLGHSSLSATARYLQVRSNPQLRSKNPFDL